MIPFLRELLWNEGKFVGFVRAGLFVTAAGFAYLATLPWQGWAKILFGLSAAVTGAMSVFIRAGEPNPKAETEEEKDSELDEHGYVKPGMETKP